MIRVIHISLSPLAGSPYRISQALNKYTNVKSRSITLNNNEYGDRVFPEDLIWEESKNECLALISEADVIHFHHYFDFFSSHNQFGFDFRDTIKASVRYTLQWHSAPDLIANLNGISVQQLHDLGIQQSVVAQFHESLYPNAYPLPLIVGDNVSVNSVGTLPKQDKKPKIFFSPSVSNSAYFHRWATKGKYEVEKILKKGKAAGYWDYTLVQGVPFHECMSLRNKADIVIDDLITGGFHTTTLESLSQGKVVLSYLDHRTIASLTQLTGTHDIPIVNVRYTEAFAVLKALAADIQLRQSIAQYGLDYFRNYYTDEIMIKKYVTFYEEMLNGKKLKNPFFKEHQSAKVWLGRDVADIVWQEHKSKEARFFNPQDLNDNINIYKRAMYQFVKKHPALYRFYKMIKGV